MATTTLEILRFNMRKRVQTLTGRLALIDRETDSRHFFNTRKELEIAKHRLALLNERVSLGQKAPHKTTWSKAE